MVRPFLAACNLWIAIIAFRSAWNAPDHERVLPPASNGEIVVLVVLGVLLALTALKLLADECR